MGGGRCAALPAVTDIVRLAMTERQPPSGADRPPQAWDVLGTLLGGIVAWGGIGWLVDLWLGTDFVKAIGIIVGVSTAIYLVVVRYGR